MEKFSEIKYVRPDVAAFKRAYKAKIAELTSAKSYKEARAAFLAMQELLSDVETDYVIAHIRNTLDTADKFYDGEMKFFNTAMAQLMPLNKKATEALIASPFRSDFEVEYGAQLFVNADIEKRIQSKKIIPEMIAQGNLENEYKKTAAACKVEFMGSENNFYGLLAHMESRNREERRAAYLEWAKLYEGVSKKLDTVYDKLIRVRVRMAKKLELPGGYTQMAYLGMHRADYTKEDVARFRAQIKEVVVPAVEELRRAQAKRLNVDKLKYYDETCVFPDGNADPIGGQDVLVPAAAKMYHELSPETGEFFDFMREHELFDLTTHPGKHLGGYCTHLARYKAPFIFSNFNGTAADVGVLTHEAGHAFEAYIASRCQPLPEYMSSTSEVNEIHSMTMEHFAYPWTALFYGEGNVKKALYSHLAEALSTLPYLVSVDEFQHRVFERPDMSAADRYAVWHEIEQKYLPWRDYDGVEFLEKGGFWMQKQHIFLYPFYYIDYALAQTCAFQLYGRMKEDREAAWSSYLTLCRAGGSRGYFQLLELAGLKNPFTEGTVEASVRHVIDELADFGY